MNPGEFSIRNDRVVFVAMLSSSSAGSWPIKIWAGSRIRSSRSRKR